MVKSPLRYPGGKSRAVQKIADFIPDFKEYREPLVGGGSVFFYLKQRFPNKKFWINDVYENLYLFWDECKINPESIIKEIKTLKANFTDGKLLFRSLNENFQTYNRTQKAAAFFVYNRITFSGTTESGGYSESAYHQRFTDSSIDRLKLVLDFLKGVSITNLDYERLVNSEGDEVFLFLDPPYFSATKSALYGKNGKLHKGFDHEKFAEVMKSCNHKWLITYDDSSYIRSLFSFANIIPWNLKYGMRNVKKGNDNNGKELFIANYDINSKKYTNLSLFGEEIKL